MSATATLDFITKTAKNKVNAGFASFFSFVL